MNLLIKSSLTLSVLFFSSPLFAADVVMSIQNLSANEFELPSSAGTAKVRVRNNSANFGLPYAVEVNASCSNGAKAGSRAIGVCDVKPGSVKLSDDGKFITVKVRETDSEAYNAKTRMASAEELMALEPSCKEEATTLKFSLADLCR